MTAVVRLRGLQRRGDLNFREGLIIESQSCDAAGRFAVALCGERKPISVKMDNMQIKCVADQVLWASGRSVFGTGLNISYDTYVALESVFPTFLSPSVSLLKRIHDYTGTISMEEKEDLLMGFEREQLKLQDGHHILDCCFDDDCVVARKFLSSVQVRRTSIWPFILDEYFKLVGGDLIEKSRRRCHGTCVSFALRPYLGELVDRGDVNGALAGILFTDDGHSTGEYSSVIWKTSMDMLGFRKMLIPAPCDIAVYVSGRGSEEIQEPVHWGVVQSIVNGVPRVRSKCGHFSVWDHDVHHVPPIYFGRATAGIFVHFFRPPPHMPSSVRKQSVAEVCAQWVDEIAIQRGVECA